MPARCEMTGWPGDRGCGNRAYLDTGALLALDHPGKAIIMQARLDEARASPRATGHGLVAAVPFVHRLLDEAYRGATRQRFSCLVNVCGVPNSLSSSWISGPAWRSNAWASTRSASALLFRIMQRIMQDVQKSAPPPLLPLLRSRLQAEVLTLVLLNPDREWTLTELASRVGSAVSSVQREVVRAEQAGVMASRRVGRTRLVRAAPSPLTKPLTELLLRSFGPRQVLADELAGVPGIDDAYLFGSWAARYAGQEGRPPADLDVLVIGTPDRDALDDAAERAGARLAREVNVTIRSANWWDSGDDGFHTEVTRRPLVPILAPEASP